MQLIYAHSGLFMPTRAARGRIGPSPEPNGRFVEMGEIHVDYAGTAPTDRAMRIHSLK
jgi:hypothetical protein